MPLLFLWLSLLALPALAQDPPSPPPAAPADEAAPVTLPAAVAAWAEAWAQAPTLVPLNKRPEGVLDSAEAIETQLKLLGTKVFSNREWRRYWEAQARSARAVADANARMLNLAEDDPARAGVVPLSDARVSGLLAWAALADDKVENQDLFLEALQAERDALEERLYALMEAEAAAELPELKTVESPSPYQQRLERLAVLARQLEVQGLKRAQAERQRAFAVAQIASEKQVLAALRRDEDLVRRELQLAREQAGLPSDALRPTWRAVAEAAAVKTQAIAADRSHHGASVRAYEVETGLIDSELAFRAKRIEALTAELKALQGRDARVAAAVDTAQAWVQDRGLRSVLVIAGLVLGLVLAGQLITRLVDALVRFGSKDDADSSRRAMTLGSIAASVLRGAVFIVAGLVALEELGVDTAPILGSVAILGLAVSFGSQNLVRDVVSGFFVLLENQYAVGDLVIINGQQGFVEAITLRTTTVREPHTGELYILPNGNISTVVNCNRGWSKIKLIIGVGYGTDMREARDCIGRIGEAMRAEPAWSAVLLEAPKVLAVVDLADSSVNLQVGARTLPGKHLGAGHELRERIYAGLNEAGIEIPFPQVVMHRPDA
jgi:small conductance mechanosensitive channel